MALWKVQYFFRKVIGTLRPFNNLIGCEEPPVGRQEGRTNVKDEIISMSRACDREKMSPRNRAGALADPSSM